MLASLLCRFARESERRERDGAQSGRVRAAEPPARRARAPLGGGFAPAARLPRAYRPIIHTRIL